MEKKDIENLVQELKKYQQKENLPDLNIIQEITKLLPDIFNHIEKKEILSIDTAMKFLVKSFPLDFVTMTEEEIDIDISSIECEIGREFLVFQRRGDVFIKFKDTSGKKYERPIELEAWFKSHSYMNERMMEYISNNAFYHKKNKNDVELKPMVLYVKNVPKKALLHEKKEIDFSYGDTFFSHTKYDILNAERVTSKYVIESKKYSQIPFLSYSEIIASGNRNKLEEIIEKLTDKQREVLKNVIAYLYENKYNEDINKLSVLAMLDTAQQLKEKISNKAYYKGKAEGKAEGFTIGEIIGSIRTMQLVLKQKVDSFEELRGREKNKLEEILSSLQDKFKNL